MDARVTAPSLHRRLLLAASIALAAFLGVTGLILDAAFRESARAALEDQLQGHVYAMLAAAEMRGGKLRLPQALPEARFSRPGSGLYGAVFGEGFNWRSKSVLGTDLSWERKLDPGVVSIEGPLSTPQGPIIRFAQGIAWELEAGKPRRFTFNVIEEMGSFNAQVAGFRKTLWLGLGLSALLLLAFQFLVLRWSLKPLRTIARELTAVEAGRQRELKGHYPMELQTFKEHLNNFIQAEHESLTRYRNTLADLAHSLKTPLAVLRGAMEQNQIDADSRRRLLEQVTRMDELVAFRLKKAARAGGRRLGLSTRIEPVAAQLLQALSKVYVQRELEVESKLQAGVRFPGEEGDLYELLGNLLDNAFKSANKRVSLRVREDAAHDARVLIIQVADDGPGIATDRVSELLQRGVRGDELSAGHGIGLAMVDEIVRAYGGSLDIGQSQWGGACITARLVVAA